jgi:carboxypeptidase PM20D1
MIKRTLAAILLLFLVAVAANTWRQGSQQIQVAALAPLPLDLETVSQHLAGALRFRTISSASDANLNATEFAKLHVYLQRNYPHVHATLSREVIGKSSLLYKWQGSDPSAKPVLLMAHQDVVPIAPSTEASWQHPPFDGVVDGDFIWGRGAWDDKGNLIAMFEALERLAADGFKPRQTIYLASGADEESGGKRGAGAIAALLQERGVKLAYVLDEGLIITEGVLKGLSKPLALIGIAEKGYATVLLSMQGPPGHSSMPPPTTLIGSMSAALVRVEAAPYPARVSGAARAMLGTLAPEMSGLNRVLLSNLWLSRELVAHELQKTPSANAMLRTTTALTIIHAGDKDNVMPGSIEATVNFRLMPGDTESGVLARLRNVIANDAIKLTPAAGNTPPSRIADAGSAEYQTINRTVRELFPDTVVAPGLMIGATDARYFEALADNVYRFSPVHALPEDLARFHGANERISVKNFADLIRFYHRLLTYAG